MEVIKTPEELNKYPNADNGIVKIYTKDYVLASLKKVIKAKTKRKVNLPEYDTLQENYCLLINDNEVDFSKITSVEKNSIAKLEIINSKEGKNKILIELKK